MKCAVVLCVLLVAVYAAEEKYTTKYDNVDIDAILANDRLTTNYVKCLLDTGKCNEDGKTLKSVVPDALITACKKCSDKQKESVRKVAHHLIKNRRADWDTLVAKYDPEGTYRHNYQKYLDEVSQ
ncbi:chemosensory protein [Rhyzopertha dominica]|uniref:Chemosensory protein 4 n=1 Tax=Rhyzopertha dominica TaxID=92692 RepID=A0A109NPE1_RHYDO|nr:chemosensory protein 4 [Rhyzopertha dominica]KAI7815633.1 chemosensory protein [Rhyzopertha dominica]